MRPRNREPSPPGRKRTPARDTALRSAAQPGCPGGGTYARPGDRARNRDPADGRPSTDRDAAKQREPDGMQGAPESPWRRDGCVYGRIVFFSKDAIIVQINTLKIRKSSYNRSNVGASRDPAACSSSRNVVRTSYGVAARHPPTPRVGEAQLLRNPPVSGDLEARRRRLPDGTTATASNSAFRPGGAGAALTEEGRVRPTNGSDRVGSCRALTGRVHRINWAARFPIPISYRGHRKTR